MRAGDFFFFFLKANFGHLDVAVWRGERKPAARGDSAWVRMRVGFGPHKSGLESPTQCQYLVTDFGGNDVAPPLPLSFRVFGEPCDELGPVLYALHVGLRTLRKRALPRMPFSQLWILPSTLPFIGCHLT